MIPSLNIENISFALSVLTVIFGVYLYFRKPQIESEVRESKFELQISSLRDELTNLRDNHFHSLQLRIDDTNQALAGVTIQLAKLATVIDERVPKKNV